MSLSHLWQTNLGQGDWVCVLVVPRNLCVTLGKSLLSGHQIPNEGLTGSVPLHIWGPSHRPCCLFSLRLIATGPLLLLHMKAFLSLGNQRGRWRGLWGSSEQDDPLDMGAQISILRMSQLEIRGVKWLAQAHTAGESMVEAELTLCLLTPQPH